jgi:zinc protease
MRAWLSSRAVACQSLVVAVAFASSACARFAEAFGPTSLRSIEIPFHTVTLDNGLRVLLNEDHRVPIVAIAVTYGVGTSDSPPDKPSLAHTFEHLMFQGSAHVAGQGHIQHLERVGAPRLGGVVDADVTTYFETVPANQLELALWLESDRMGFLIDGIDQQKLNRVRPVIENEERQRFDNAIVGRVGRFLLAAIFPEGHPYHNADAHLVEAATVTVEDARQFGRTYCLPNNATLALSGDFDSATAVTLVDRYFGSLPPGPRPSHPRATAVSLSGQVRLDLAAAVGREEVLIAWPTPALGQPGDAELEVAALTLQAGLLRSALVEPRPIALTVEARQHSFQRAGLFVIRIVLRPGSMAEAAIKAVDEQLRIVRDLAGGIVGALDAAHGIVNARLHGAQTLAGRADHLSRFDVLLGKPGYLWQEIDRYDSVGASDVRNAIVRYLPEEKRATVVVHADPSAPVGGRLVRKP